MKVDTAFGNGYLWGVETTSENLKQLEGQERPERIENTISEFVRGDWIADRELVTDARLLSARADINVVEFDYEKDGRTYWRRLEYCADTIRDSTNIPKAHYEVMPRGLTAFHYRDWKEMPIGARCSPFVEKKRAGRGWDKAFRKRGGKTVRYKTHHDSKTCTTTFTMQVRGYGFPGRKRFTSSREWFSGIAKPKTGVPDYDRAFSDAARELSTLIMYEEKRFLKKPRRVLAAGYPAFCSVFGRDSDITNYGLVHTSPELVKENIEFRLQRLGRRKNVSTSEAPGKAVHEWNMDELTNSGVMKKHFPNFIGTDESPLLETSIARYTRITGDDSILKKNHTRIKRLWDYIQKSRDGRGYLSYDSDVFDENGRRVYFTRNHTWRDSNEGVIHPDGKTLPKQPIRTLWDQCCLYGMLDEMEALARSGERYKKVVERALGIRSADTYLSREKERLKRRINKDFWMEDLEAYAIALDGSYNQVRTVNSDACLGLYYKAFDEGEAARFIEKTLMSKGRLLDDWGIRSISKEHPAYSPSGYHLGGVWPFQTEFAAIGARKYNLNDAANKLSGINQKLISRLGSLPEVLDAECGNSPRPQSKSCNPQAWSAGTLLFSHYENRSV